MHKNFTIYIPEDPFLKSLHEQHNIVFMKSDSGKDWYDIQKELKPEMITIFCSAEGKVFGASKDPSTIAPVAGGFCFQVKEYDYLDKAGDVIYNKETKEFTLTSPKKSLNTLLKELKVLEIKKDLGDKSLTKEILAKKREILELTSEE